MRSLITVLLVVFYLITTYISVLRSSQPTEPCQENSRPPCLRPLVASEDRLSVELWMLREYDHGPNADAAHSAEGAVVPKPKPKNTSYQWSPVDSCREGLAFDVSESTTIIDGTSDNGNNCTIDLPPSSRRRGGDPLLAKFVLRKGSGRNSTVVAETKFDVTRMVERKKGGSSTLVPHFKYSQQSGGVVLRFVNDQQLYNDPPYRGDGMLLRRHPFHGNKYRPIIYVDDNALRHSSQVEMAESGHGRSSILLKIRISVVSPMRDVVHKQVDMGMKMAESVFQEDELDEIRYLISDDHIYRFILMQIISFLHIWLDYMAFRDEVDFYVGRTDMGGLSPSSVVSRFVCSLIIFLYLLEGGGTSWLILFSVITGLSADAWKAWKVLKPTISTKFPFIAMRESTRLSHVEKETARWDRIARTYMSLILYPMIAGSALYAWRFFVYKSWWSWFISNLANAVYTYGFVALCPQLYINYRLKSIAHMPWKCFLYKVFNTFIDDAFAFLIESPLKHKVMTLRDDLVFVVFLVQAYIYRVDMTRANEFGFAYQEGAALEKTDPTKEKET